MRHDVRFSMRAINLFPKLEVPQTSIYLHLNISLGIGRQLRNIVQESHCKALICVSLGLRFLPDLFTILGSCISLIHANFHIAWKWWNILSCTPICRWCGEHCQERKVSNEAPQRRSSWPLRGLGRVKTNQAFKASGIQVQAFAVGNTR